MNIPTVKRQVIRAYVFLIADFIINLSFVGSTLGLLVLQILSFFGHQSSSELVSVVKPFVLIIFIAKVLWSIAYYYARKRIKKQFDESGLGIGLDGADQVSSITKLLHDKTEALKKEKELIMAKHGNDPEKAKRELVLLLIKNGGKAE